MLMKSCGSPSASLADLDIHCFSKEVLSFEKFGPYSLICTNGKATKNTRVSDDRPVCQPGTQKTFFPNILEIAVFCAF